MSILNVKATLPDGTVIFDKPLDLESEGWGTTLCWATKFEHALDGVPEDTEEVMVVIRSAERVQTDAAPTGPVQPSVPAPEPFEDEDEDEDKGDGVMNTPTKQSGTSPF